MKNIKILHNLSIYFGKKKYLLIIILILVIYSSFSSIYGTYMIKDLINIGIIESDYDYLYKNLIILIILYSFSFLSKLIYTELMILISQEVIYKLRKTIFKKILSLPLSYFSLHPVGEIMNLNTNNLESTISSLNSSFVNLLSAFFTIIFTLIFMFILNYIISLISLIILIITISFILINSKKIKYYHNKHHDTMFKINSLIEEDLRGFKLNKTYLHYEKSLKKFDEVNLEWKEDATNAFFHTQFHTPFIVSLSYLNFSICAICGFLLIIYNNLGVSGISILTPLLMYVRQSATPFNTFSVHLNAILSSLTGLSKIFKFLENKEENLIDNGKVTIIKKEEKYFYKLGSILKEYKGRIEFKNVSFSYTNNNLILDNISFKVNKGECVAIIGETGVGKSTIINLLNRFYEVDKGEILLDDINIKDIKLDSLRSLLSNFSESVDIFSNTIKYNISYPNLGTKFNKIKEASVKAKAHNFIIKLKDSYDTFLFDSGNNLSQGEKELIQIARIYIKDSPILILDEATSNIDTKSEKNILNSLSNSMKDKTTIIIAHRLNTIKNSSSILVIKNKKIIERGTHDDLISIKKEYYSLLNKE